MSDVNPVGDEVSQTQPWLGLSSFSEETRQFFYGREEEVSELARRVQRKLLTVLFGQSGLGKTSILRAGLAPRLREQGYCPVYVRIDYGRGAPSAQQQIKQAILRETAGIGSWTRSGVATDEESLWEFLHHRDDFLLDAEGKRLVPLLIVDQFEEIFTLAQSDEDGRQRAADFLEGLAGLVENRPSKDLEAKLEEDDTAVERFDFARNDYRILITLREDYLAHLETLKAAMPSITQNRLRLAPMTGTQALAAVTGPGGKLVSEEVAAAIVRFVAGGAELANAQVEPSLLSLICRELNDKRIAARREEITLDLLAGSHASILTDFYERTLLDQPQLVRNMIEDVLLTESGYRENVAEERIVRLLAEAGAVPDAQTVLALLVNRRLLRIENRLDIRRVELTHDVLCNVVGASRSMRHEREQRAAAEEALHAQRERERGARKSLVRARQVMVGCLVLTLAAVASAVFGYINMKRAQETRILADTSRDGAEKLVGYLLDDFYTQLQPIGRVDMIDGLARRTANYYQNLPDAMRSRETDANYARALLRLGEVIRSEGNLIDAGKVLDQSIALLEPVVAANKSNEANSLVLSEVLLQRGMVAFSTSERTLASKLIDRATLLATPFASAPNASLAARLTYALARTRVGFVKLRNFDMTGARIDFDAARALLANGAERSANIPAMIAYLDAGRWILETLGRGDVKDYEASDKLAQDIIDGTDEVLKQRPFDKDALRIKLGVYLIEGHFLQDQGLASRSLALWQEGARVASEQLRADPQNSTLTDSMALHVGLSMSAMALLGRPSDAIAESEKVWALYERTPPTAFQAFNLLYGALRIGEVYAELGDTKQVAAMEHRIDQYAQLRTKGLPQQAAQAITLLGQTWSLSLSERLDPTSISTERLADFIRRDEQLLAQSESQETNNYGHTVQRVLRRIQAHRAYAAGDYQLAETSSRLALDAELQRDFASPDLPVFRMELALALARMKKLPEASALIQEVLKVQRGQIANGADDQILRLELAQSLYVSALTQPGAGSKELAEAATLIAKLPAAIQNYRSVVLWRQRIADEIRLNTRAALAIK